MTVISCDIVILDSGVAISRFLMVMGQFSTSLMTNTTGNHQSSYPAFDPCHTLNVRVNYTGQWVQGEREGNGTTSFRDGAVYTGAYRWVTGHL